MAKNILNYLPRICFALGSAAVAMYGFYTLRIAPLKNNHKLLFEDPKNLYDFYIQYRDQLANLYLCLLINYLLMIAIGFISGFLIFAASWEDN